MAKLLFQFVAIAFMGSVVIVMSARILGPREMPAPVVQAGEWLHENAPLGTVSHALRSALLSKQHLPEPAPARSAPRPASPVAGVPTAVSSGTASGTPPARTTRPPASTPEPTRTVTAGATPTWAIVRKPEAKVYTTGGKFLRRATAGTVVMIQGSKTTSIGEVMTCKGTGPARNDPPFLVGGDDLDLQYANYRTIDARHASQLIQLAKLKAELFVAMKASRSAVRTDNPHATHYAETREVYRDYWREVKDLERQRTDGTGQARTEAADKLRMMKGEDIRIGQAYEAAKKEYDAWNAAHPTDEEPSTPEVRALRERIDRLASHLQSS